MPERSRSSRVVLGLGELRHPFRSEAVTGDGVVDAEAAAHERGRAEGFAEGRREAGEVYAAETAAMRVELATALGRIANLESDLSRRHQETMIELALEAASKIVRETVEAGNPVAARALREAVDALPSGGTLKARLHPDELEPVRERLAALIEREQIELIADPALSRGGCVVQSSAGTIDATIEAAREAVDAAANGRTERP